MRIKIPLNNKILIHDEKDIKGMCTYIRKTPEYKKFIIFCKQFLNMNKCAIFKNYNMYNGFIINLHHAPLTLFDYTNIITKKSLVENNYYIKNDVMNAVIRLHYQLKVGLVPLSPGVHDIIHKLHKIKNEKKDIPPVYILFNWKQFIEEYKQFIDESLFNKLETLERNQFVTEKELTHFFEKKPIMINESNNDTLNELKKTLKDIDFDPNNF